MNKNFYRTFEEKHYAPRSIITQLRQQYLPFVRPLARLYPGANTYDMGCGRGEWLELMLNAGMKPFGIDLDEGMLQGCRELHLPAQQGNALPYLSTLPDNSQAVISAFHVVEHIAFNDLRMAVSEALRVLRPGGLLIMETPNPENIVVATNNFYLDPTHIRPIPPKLLAFLTEFSGFARTKVLRLQESKQLSSQESISLNDVLGGASPDYAVIAQKAASPETLTLFDGAFNKEYGLSTEQLGSRYDEALTAKIQAIQIVAERAENQATQAEQRATQAEQRATQAENRILQSEQHTDQVLAHLHAVLESRSWRLTAPLRWLSQTLRWFVRGSIAWLTFKPGSRPRRVARLILMHLKLYVGLRPRLRAIISRCLAPFPGLKARLKSIGAEPAPSEAIESIPKPLQLSPRANQFYTRLKIALTQRHNEEQN